jgi:hypothetical protein
MGWQMKSTKTVFSSSLVVDDALESRACEEKEVDEPRARFLLLAFRSGAVIHLLPSVSCLPIARYRGSYHYGKGHCDGPRAGNNMSFDRFLFALRD